MRGTAMLLLMCSISPVAIGQAAVESGMMPHVPSPVAVAPQLPVPAASAPAVAAPVTTVSVPAAPVSAREQAASKQFHDNVVKLIGLTGLRQEMLSNRQAAIQKDKEEMLRKSPTMSRAFADEVARQLGQKMSVDDFVNVVVTVYEKNFSNDDVLEMIQARQGGPGFGSSALSSRLQAKLQAAGGIHDQIVSGFAELGQKLGTEIVQDIAKKHPEWLLPEEEPFTKTSATGSTGGERVTNEAATIVAADAESSGNFVVTPAN